MITGELRGKVDRLWTTFWNNGISNPLSVIEQVTYLIFMRRLDELERVAEKAARRFGGDFVPRFGPEEQGLRWSQLRLVSDPGHQLRLAARAFEHIKALPGTGDTPYARHMKEAVFLITRPALLSSAIRQVEEIFDLLRRQEDVEAEEGTRKDLKGDLYEYMLSKLSQAGTNGQFRTPRHIIRMMVELVRPTVDDTVCDPACGTAGFLVGVAEYLKENHRPELVDESVGRRFAGPMFAGYDFDGTMLRIGSMNLLLHGIVTPDVDQGDSLSEARKHVRERFSLVLANPPFKGSVDMDGVAEDLLQALGLARQKPKRARRKAATHAEVPTLDAKETRGPAAKTELLFLAQILGSLQPSGRAAVIVPDGVLFGSTKAHRAIRQSLVDVHQLVAVVSMPSGVFKPYAGVSTAILVFTRTDHGGTEKVWFYDMQADGYSLDDKRQPVPEDDIPDVIQTYRTREPERDCDRTARAFFVPRAEIVANGYDLSINRYREVQTAAVEYEAPRVVLARLRALEEEIRRGIEELEGMMR